MKIDPILINLMNLENSKLQFVDLIKNNKHRKINGVYNYAFIVSKYSTALKPINYDTAESVANKIEKVMLSKDFSVFIIGLTKSGWSITDEDVADAFRAVAPRLNPNILEFYRELGAPI